MRWIVAVFVLGLVTDVSAKKIDWAARAKAVAWTFEATSTLDWAMRVEGYDVELAHRSGQWRDIEIKVTKAGKVIHQWKGTAETPLVVQRDVLYYVHHHPIASGAEIVAVDLKSGKQRFKKPLKGLGPISHSKYRNQVWLQVHHDVIVVLGQESSGKYVELVDFGTGTTLANELRK
jgi:hypothetical protein